MPKANFSIPRVIVSLVILMLACSLPEAVVDFLPEKTAGETEIWQEEVDAIKTLTRSQPIPGFLIDPETPPSGELFDPNDLLVPLDHLSLQSGYTLDFVYRYDGIGGKPILYARKMTDPPLERFEDGSNAHQHPYLNAIVCDGTPEAYFQWVLLHMMGDQFYLYWHAGYHDTEIIASQERLEALVLEMRSSEFGFPFTRAQQRQALRINPAPVVEIEDQIVKVRVVSFSKWRGFTESFFTISRTAPHQVLDLEENNLMEYDCGVMF